MIRSIIVRVVRVRDKATKEVLYALKGEDDDFYYDESNFVRTFSSEVKAIGYLKRAYSEFRNGNVYVVRLDQSLVPLYDSPQVNYGPHDWRKINLFTISDRAGMYDLLQCSFCGKKQKRFGLRELPGGECKKNLIK